MKFWTISKPVLSKCARAGAVLSCVVGLSACIGLGYDSVKDATPSGSEFNKALFAGYVELSGNEFSEYDYLDSDGFAAKARSAASDGNVQPADLAEWRIPDEHTDTLSKARARLTKALDASGRTKAPGSAAHAQVMFDCWVQEQEENHQPEDIAACRNAFFGAIVAVETELRPGAAAAAEPEPAPAPAPEPDGVPSFFVIFFEHNSSTVSPVAMTTIREIASSAKAMHAYKANVHGHTDTSGNAAYNLKLADQRARAIVKAIIEAGGKQLVMDVESLGEQKLAAKTADNVRDGRNRRVEITLE